MLMQTLSKADVQPQALPNTIGVDTPLFANQVEKTYSNGTHALSRVKLAIERGEFVSLLGPSGCGKSTLLKMFAGLEQPSAGHVRWWGKDAPGTDHHAGTPGRSLAMVFQEATLMPWAKVHDNVRLPLDLAGAPRPRASSRCKPPWNWWGWASSATFTRGSSPAVCRCAPPLPGH